MTYIRPKSDFQLSPEDKRNLLDEEGYFSLDVEVQATKDAEYLIELYADDTNPGLPGRPLNYKFLFYPTYDIFLACHVKPVLTLLALFII
jgi:hypothetical protein